MAERRRLIQAWTVLTSDHGPGAVVVQQEAEGGEWGVEMGQRAQEGADMLRMGLAEPVHPLGGVKGDQPLLIADLGPG